MKRRLPRVNSTPVSFRNGYQIPSLSLSLNFCLSWECYAQVTRSTGRVDEKRARFASTDRRWARAITARRSISIPFRRWQAKGARSFVSTGAYLAGEEKTNDRSGKPNWEGSPALGRRRSVTASVGLFKIPLCSSVRPLLLVCPFGRCLASFATGADEPRQA